MTKAFIVSILSIIFGLGFIIPIVLIISNIFSLKIEKSNKQFLIENRFIPVAYNYSLINFSHLTLEKIINLKETDIIDYKILCEDGKNYITIKTNSNEFKILIDKIEFPKNNKTKDLVLYANKNIVGIKILE